MAASNSGVMVILAMERLPVREGAAITNGGDTNAIDDDVRVRQMAATEVMDFMFRFVDVKTYCYCTMFDVAMCLCLCVFWALGSTYLGGPSFATDVAGGFQDARARGCGQMV